MKDKYTLIGYRENYSNSCRGCEMERYSSAFDVSQYETLEEVIEAYAKEKGVEEGYDHAGPMDFVLLKNGNIIFDEAWMATKVYSEEEEEEEESIDLGELAKGRIEELKQGTLAEAKRKAEKERAKKEANKKAADLARLAELKAQYERV